MDFKSRRDQITGNNLVCMRERAFYISTDGHFILFFFFFLKTTFSDAVWIKSVNLEALTTDRCLNKTERF